MTHELKCWPNEFNAVLRGQKKFEFRKNDRDFRAGEYLLLREWEPTEDKYSGLELRVYITYILTEGFGLPEGYCIMSIREEQI